MFRDLWGFAQFDAYSNWNEKLRGFFTLITGAVSSSLFSIWSLNNGNNQDNNHDTYLIKNKIGNIYGNNKDLKHTNKYMKKIHKFKNFLEYIKNMFYIYSLIYTNLLKLILGGNIDNLIPSLVMFGSDDGNNKGSLDKGKGKAIDQNPDSDNDSNSSGSPKNFLDKGKGKEVDSTSSSESIGSNSRKRKRDDSELEDQVRESQVHGSLTQEEQKMLRDLEFKHFDPNTNYENPHADAEKRYEKIKADLDQKLAECCNKEYTSEVESEIDKLVAISDHIEGQRFERKLEQLENSYTENQAKRTKVESVNSDLEEGEWETWGPWESRQETRNDESSGQPESSRARCTEEEHRKLDREYEETREQRKKEQNQEKKMQEEQRKEEEREKLMQEEIEEEERRQAKLDNTPDGLYDSYLENLVKITGGWFYINDKIVPPVPPWKESEKKPYPDTPKPESNSSSSSNIGNTSNPNITENSSVNTTSASTSVPVNTISNTDTLLDNTNNGPSVGSNIFEDSAPIPIPRPINPETTSEIPQDSSVSSNTEDEEDKSRRRKELSNDPNSSNDNNTSKKVSMDQDVNIQMLDKPIYQDTIGQDSNTPIFPNISQDLITPICPNNGQHLETPVSDSQGLHLIKPKNFIECCQDIFIGIPVDNGSPIDYVVDQMTCDMPTYIWDDGD